MVEISTQTRLMQELQLMDPYLDHPKSSMGCIKCIKMVEKQWFGSHDGWMPQFWLKNQKLLS
jgi:hypothetical protein